jgi:hypothetical protein
MKNGSTKNACWDVNNKKWRKLFFSPFFFNNTYDLPVLTMDSKCRNEEFYVDYSIYRLCVLNSGWKIYSPNNYIRTSLLDMKPGSTKYVFWDVNNNKWRKYCKLVSTFLFNNTYGLPVLTMDTKCPIQVFFVWLDVLQTIRNK